MSVDEKQLDKTTKIIGFRVTEEELQNIIYPVMHDCYDMGIIDHDTLTSFLRFCVQFWMGHYRQKKLQFAMSQQEIDEEKRKLAAILAEKEAWHKWDNSTVQVMQKNCKRGGNGRTAREGVCRDTSIIITKTTAKETAANNSIQDDNSSKPISGGYDGIKMSNEADNNNNNDNIQ
jgi:hypothetical protein